MKQSEFIISIIVLLSLTFASAGEEVRKTSLPETCSSGWIKDGKPKVYMPQNLYEYINGEAELYLPYGFKQLTTSFYREAGAKGVGLVVNVFVMGSSLDAFGIYANYRSASADPINSGSGGCADESQLMYYQDRYFVQIMASGSPNPDRAVFLSCAASISKILPPGSGRPDEVDLLNIPGLTPGSEKYYPEGLLGYKFLGRGLTAEAASKGGPLRAIIIMADSDKALERAFHEYRNYLMKSGAAPKLTNEKAGIALRAIDPLYEGVIFQQSGRYAVGVTGVIDSAEAEVIIQRLIERLPG
jgi:hypothetical protein